MEINGSDLEVWFKKRINSRISWINGCPDIIDNISFDSRKITGLNTIFVALNGDKKDGHDFATKAKYAGAIGCIVSRELEIDIPQIVVKDTLRALTIIGEEMRYKFNGKIIAITGSCGKTTTKQILQSIFGDDKSYSRLDNWNNIIGVSINLFDLRCKSLDFAIIEAGISKKGEMDKLGSMIKPNLCIVTDISDAHLDGLVDLDTIAIEKSKILDYMCNEKILIAPNKVLEMDKFSSYKSISILKSKGLQKPQFLNRLNKCLKLYLFDSSYLGNGYSKVVVKDESNDFIFDYNIFSTSEGVIQNSVLTFACAKYYKIDTKLIIQGIGNWAPDYNRGNFLKIDGVFYYNDSYNANPMSMKDSLLSFYKLTKDKMKRTYVLGVMNELGSDSNKYHYEITKYFLPYNENDKLILVGSSEQVSYYERGAKDKGWKESNIESYCDSEKAKSELANFSGYVFLKGSRNCNLELLIPKN